MPLIIPGNQRDENWRMVRLAIPTASNFDAVMAKGRTAGSEAATRRNYRYRLAIEELTGIPQENDFPETWDIKQGIKREPLAVCNFELITGLDVQEVCFVRSDEMPIGCSPDGLVGDDSGIECKCGNQATHGSYLRLVDQPPSEYKWQVYGSMLVTGRESWYFVSYHPDYPPSLQTHIVKVMRDEDQIGELRAGLERFITDVKATVVELQIIASARGLDHVAA